MNTHAPQRDPDAGGDPRRLDVKASWLSRPLGGLMQIVLDRIDDGLERGTLALTLPDGAMRELGGKAPGFTARVDLRSWRAVLRLVTAGSAGWYHAWEADEWRSPDPVALFALYMDNVVSMGRAARAHGPWRWMIRLLQKRRPADRAAAGRLKPGGGFLAAWLDASMTVSGARFDAEVPASDDPDARLAAGQQRKTATVMARIAGAQTVLDMGCGFGALAGEMARAGMDVTAVDTSDIALRWAATRQPGRIDFQRCDWREIKGAFDAITCIEMVETIGQDCWPRFIETIGERLKPGGRAALQFVTMREDLFNDYAAHPDFVQACVQPGLMVPGVQELRRLAGFYQLDWCDEVRFGDDYAETLRLWRVRLDAAIAAGAVPAGLDERFVRLWRYLLMYCEGGFRGQGLNVVQVTLVKAGAGFEG